MYAHAQPRGRIVPSRAFADARRRHRRWRFFQVVFSFTYVGIVFDLITTAIGTAKAGSLDAYEQNPLGGQLIGHLGWVGLFLAMTALMLVAYVSVRTAYPRVRLGWLRLINGLMVCIGAVRWLAVVTAVMYILQPAH